MQEVDFVLKPPPPQGKITLSNERLSRERVSRALAAFSQETPEIRTRRDTRYAGGKKGGWVAFSPQQLQQRIRSRFDRIVSDLDRRRKEGRGGGGEIPRGGGEI